MNKITSIACLAALLLGGCILGERPPASCAVSVSFPVLEQQEAGRLTGNDPRVQEALKLIDVVLNSHGFTRDAGPLPGNEPNLFATYAKDIGKGFGPGRGPNVYL